MSAKGFEELSVESRDGTRIGYERGGSGPLVVLVAAALSDRSDTTRLAKLLAGSFTVVNYDRRGRGASGDTSPYEQVREVEDLAAIIDANGGEALVFGSSSGAVLALEAGARLTQVRRLFLYEPPFIVDDAREPVADDLLDRVTTLVDSGRGSDAVRLFFREALGANSLMILATRLMFPAWSTMVRMARTISYDLTIMRGLQSGRPLPRERWASVGAPTLVMVGEKADQNIKSGSAELAGLLRHAEYAVLPGAHHATPIMKPSALLPAIESFFTKEVRA